MHSSALKKTEKQEINLGEIFRCCINVAHLAVEERTEGREEGEKKDAGSGHPLASPSACGQNDHCRPHRYGSVVGQGV